MQYVLSDNSVNVWKSIIFASVIILYVKYVALTIH